MVITSHLQSQGYEFESPKSNSSNKRDQREIKGDEFFLKKVSLMLYKIRINKNKLKLLIEVRYIFLLAYKSQIWQILLESIGSKINLINMTKIYLPLTIVIIVYISLVLVISAGFWLRSLFLTSCSIPWDHARI